MKLDLKRKNYLIKIKTKPFKTLLVAEVEIPINLTPSRQFQIDPQSCCLKQAEVVVQKGILE